MAGLSKLLGIIQAIFVWGSLVVAAGLLITMIIQIKKHGAQIKNVLTALISGAYIVAFIILKIFFSGAFELIAGVVFWGIALVSTQLTKYEDRVAGRRGWYD